MMSKWKASGTRGVRYYEHETRRHGVRKDRYFAIRFQAGGVRREEALGWASEGWTERKAAAVLAELQENNRLGSGPRTLAEKREIAEAQRREQDAQERLAAKAAITFHEMFTEHYLPHIKANRRSERAINTEIGLFRRWIEPAIGHKTFGTIAALDMERIKRDMAKAGRAPRSIEYALAVVRQVFNHAINHDFHAGKNPAGGGGKVKRPKIDNRRMRFLTKKEADDLLSLLATVSQDVHHMSLFALHTGARASEIFALTWADVDLNSGIITIKDTKNNRNRPAFMTEAVKAMLQARTKGQPSELVFPGRGGKRIAQISHSFDRVVAQLGLNEGISDRRQRITFHSLRHTYASWLVANGTDIYTVKELMGHSDLKLTARYAHVGENAMRSAVEELGQAINR
ncbi:tyrosine-type recombinase/integrase [Thiovibrio sp. JS02]